MRNAAAYVRVSTERQDEYSLDSQLKLIRDYAAAHDMIVPDEFVCVSEYDRAGQGEGTALRRNPCVEIQPLCPQPGGEHIL